MLQMDKAELIRILKNIATLLEIKGENPFKARAYLNAATYLIENDIDIFEHVRNGTLGEIEGFGKALIEKISDYVLNGKMKYYERLIEEIPESLVEITKIPGIGPKKAKLLYEKLGITDIDELEEACLESRVRQLKGFTEKTIEMILNSIQHIKASRGRFLQEAIKRSAENLINEIKKLHDVNDAVITGNFRRFAETLSELNIIVNANYDISFQEFLSQFKSLIPINIMITKPDNFIWQLHQTTGSEEYISEFLKIAESKGLKYINGELYNSSEKLVLVSEKELYDLLNLQFVEPELRESPKILEKAKNYALPNLVTEQDLKGMIHCHSDWSDGKNTIKEMALASKELGFEYFVICDHSRSASYANGLSIERIYEQHKEIDELNSENLGIKIYKGIESDILPDGSLDYPEEILKLFDIVIASVHSSFKMSRSEMTRRITYALRSPFTTMLGHPTGRLLLARPPYEVDVHEIIDVAASEDKIIEINANPYRLDLPWEYLEFAKSKSVKISINPDSHNVNTLLDVFIGVKVARKGGLEAADIINCLNLYEFEKFIREKK